MDRRQLESAGASYPHLHVQGLYGIPFGMAMALVGFTNLERTPVWAVLAGMALTVAVLAGVNRYYRHNFGKVTPMRSRQTRYLVAAVAGFAVYIGADQLARAVLGRPPLEPISTTAAAWALGMLVFYAVAARPSVHHVVIWVAVFVAGLLPVWTMGVEKEALAFFPIAAASMAVGLLDHRRFVLTIRSYRKLGIQDNHGDA